MQFKYEESQKLLPSSILISNQSSGGCDRTGMDDKEKNVTVSDNNAVVEYLFEDSKDDLNGEFTFYSKMKKYLYNHITDLTFSIASKEKQGNIK